MSRNLQILDESKEPTRIYPRVMKDFSGFT